MKLKIEKRRSKCIFKISNQIFFNGDSDILLNTCKIVLDNIGEGIKAVDDKIMVVKICYAVRVTACGFQVQLRRYGAIKWTCCKCWKIFER
jgi:hypothetical protein